MATINKDNPCLFVTTVARDRLPVFRTDALKDIACRALDEARSSGGFALFAYVIMPEHRYAWTWRKWIGGSRDSLEAAGRRSLALNRNGIGWPAERRSLSASQAAEPHLSILALAEKCRNSRGRPQGPRL